MRFPYDTSYLPPAPALEIRLGSPEAPLRVGPLSALVDTGADVCIVPTRYIEPLGMQVDNRKLLKGAWGEQRPVDVYLLDLGIGEMRFPLVEIVADDRGDDVILGRNVLNKLVARLDGPRTVLELTA